MAEIEDYLPVADDNTGRWPEGQTFPTMNNAARENEAMAARGYGDSILSKHASTGTGAQYIVPTTRAQPKLFDGLQIRFTAHVDSDANAQINWAGQGLRQVKQWDNSDPPAGYIKSGQPVIACYFAASSVWKIVNLGPDQSSVIPISRGGTGKPTAAEGFDALAPTTTEADLIVRGAGGNERLPVGADDTYLGVSGGALGYHPFPQQGGTLVSDPYPITSGGLVTWTHGQPGEPLIVQFQLECVVADDGYAIGDKIFLGPCSTLDTSNNARSSMTTAIIDTAGELSVRYASRSQVFSAGNKATGSASLLDNSDWQMRIIATF